MEDKLATPGASIVTGFRYFYELFVGTIILVFVSFQSWMALRLIQYGAKLAQLEAERITRVDFERWREEQQLQLDELRASSIASGQQAVNIVKESQEKLEAQLRHGLDRMDNTQREILMLLAKKGLNRGE